MMGCKVRPTVLQRVNYSPKQSWLACEVWRLCKVGKVEQLNKYCLHHSVSLWKHAAGGGTGDAVSESVMISCHFIC